MAPPAYTVLEISGADAGDFLRAQLTIDVQRLGDDRHGLAAWCDAKGRALCTFRVLPGDAGYLLILPAALTGAISRRLRMFVLRSRVEITDVSSNWTLTGAPVTNAADARRPADGLVTRGNDTCLLALDTGGGPGTLHLQHGPAPGNALALDSNAWQLAEIDAGLPVLGTATSGLFVPQMLNLHWLDAIEFDKGCYPGQEVVARLQYRGRLTRRTFRLHWHGPQPAPGDTVVDHGGSRQGTIVQAAQSAPGEGRLLAVLAVNAVDTPLASGQTRLSLLDLPYPTDEPAVPEQQQ